MADESVTDSHLDVWTGNGPVDPAVLEIYRIAVDSSYRVSEWRQRANGLLLTVSVGVFGAIGWLLRELKEESSAVTYLGLLGCMVATVWLIAIKHYRILNGAKFEVIHEIEQRLPLRVFDAEWHRLQRGLGRYRPVTHVESIVPVIALVGFVVTLIWNLCR